MFIVNVTLDGRIHTFGKFDFRVDLNQDSKVLHEVKGNSPKPSFIMDSLVTVNYWNNLVVMYNAVGDYDQPTPMLAEFDTHQGTMRTSQINGFDGSAINALLSNKNDTYYTFSIENAGSKGNHVLKCRLGFRVSVICYLHVAWNVKSSGLICIFFSGYNFVVGQLYLIKNTLPYRFRKLISSGPEPLYVNYQWAELDIDRQLLYVLMGNENTPNKLLAKLYTYDLQKMYVFCFLPICKNLISIDYFYVLEWFHWPIMWSHVICENNKNKNNHFVPGALPVWWI